MKRDKLNYEVYNHYGLFFWQECFICKKEFRREKSFRIFSWRYFLYICSEHANSKQGAVWVYEDSIKKRPPITPTPPPKRS